MQESVMLPCRTEEHREALVAPSLTLEQAMNKAKVLKIGPRLYGLLI